MDTSLTTQNHHETGMTRVKNYMLSPEVKERFSEMMGANGIYYLNQVLILVANSNDLQQCDPKSILISAMRAASLKLSVDPAQGQAWIIPYKGKATFQLGYRGVYELALRTNLYRFINVIGVYEGEELIENRMTGNHTFGGQRISDKVTAYMLYFQLINGFEKTFVMTVKEIDEHARRYSAAYHMPKSKWNDLFERPKMEKKTVLMNGLRKWGRFNAADLDTIEQIESDQGWIDRSLPEVNEVSDPEPEPTHSAAQNLSDLGFGTTEPEPQDMPEEPEFEVEQPSAEPLRYDPESLKIRLAETAQKNSAAKISNEKRGLICAVLEQTLALGGDPKSNRKDLLYYLTGKQSMTEISDGMAGALYAWLKPAKDTGGGWMISDPMSVREVIAAFNASQPDQNKLF